MTAYTGLYPSMRLLLQDMSTPYSYESTTLDASITFSLDYMSGYSGDGTSITPDIAGNDKLQLICRSVLVLLRPSEGFSYKTPVLSVTRKGMGKQRLIDWLEEQVTDLEAGGHMPIESDGSVEDYLDSSDRLTDVLEDYV